MHKKTNKRGRYAFHEGGLKLDFLFPLRPEILRAAVDPYQRGTATEPYQTIANVWSVAR